jgi:hypothetical protein
MSCSANKTHHHYSSSTGPPKDHVFPRGNDYDDDNDDANDDADRRRHR